MQETMSQNVDFGHSLHFIRKNNDYKFPVFYQKIKTRIYIEYLRHRSLWLDVINNWLRLYRNVCRGYGNISGPNINVKMFKTSLLSV